MLPSLLFSLKKGAPPRIRGWPKVVIIIPWLFIGGWRFWCPAQKEEGSDLVTAVTSQFGQTPLFYHSMRWTVRRWFQGHVFKGLTLQPAHIQKKLCPTKFKNTVQENYLGMIGRWKATRGLFEAILFRGTLTAGAGKDISKLCLKLRVVGKRRWRNRPFWSPNCANPRPNRL